MACHEGKFDKVEALLQNGVDVNTELKVHFSLCNNHMTSFNFLLIYLKGE